MPNRILKESIKYSDQINGLTWFDEVVFYRLIVTADDYGCCDARVIRLKNELFPLREDITREIISETLHHLETVGLIQCYEVNGLPFLCFPTWEKHQRIRNKHRRFPAPPKQPQASGGHLTADCCQMSADCPPEVEVEVESNIESKSEVEVKRADARTDDGDPNADLRSLEEAQTAVFDAAKHAGFPDAPSDLDRLNGFIADYGAAWVLEAISRTADAGAGARNWRYLRGILSDWKRKGGVDIPGKPRAAPVAVDAKDDKAYIKNLTKGRHTA